MDCNYVKALDNGGSWHDVFNGSYKLGTALARVMTMYQAMRGSPHVGADATNACTTASPTDQASANTYIHALKDKYNAHCAMTWPVHHAADATNTIAAADPDDLAKCLTAVNEIKADLNAHIVLTSSHAQADSRNAVIATADATDLPTALALAIECGVLYNAHIASCLAPSGTTHASLSAL